MSLKELRCTCSVHKPLVLKYDDDVVEGQCRKCKKKHVLGLINGRIQKIPDELIEQARSGANAKEAKHG